MTISKNTVRRYPRLAKLLYKLGIAERRNNVPNVHRDAEANLLIGFFTLLVLGGLVTGWMVTDNYKRGVIEQASFANPECRAVRITGQSETEDAIRYTVNACGNVSNYIVSKSFSR
ncbi:MAG: hypothetical protein Kow0090_19540 [Myxococcota bacterium]